MKSTKISSLDTGLPVAGGQMISWDALQAGRYTLNGQSGGRRWDATVIRVSTGDQVRDGCSLQQQREMAQAAALLEDIRRSKVRTLYLYKRDRLCRISDEWIPFLRTCAAHGTKVVVTCPGEPPIGEGVYGQFTETLIIATAELEAQVTRMRVIDSTLGRFHDGRYIGGHLPFGLCQDEHKAIRPHPAEAPLVALVWRLAKEEMLGAMRIADRLNAERPNAFRGHPWTRQRVDKILKNRTYCGCFHITVETERDGGRQKERFEKRSDLLPVLVSEEDWALVHQMRKSRVLHRGALPSRYRGGSSLLTGIVVCGECGQPLLVKQAVQRHRCVTGAVHQYHHKYYYCSNGQGVHRCSYRGFANASLVEETVIRVCQDVLPGLNLAEFRRKHREYASNRRQELQAALAGLDADRDQTERAITRNQESLETATAVDEIEHYQERLRALLLHREEVGEQVASHRREAEAVEHSSADVERWLRKAQDWSAQFAAAALAWGRHSPGRLSGRMTEPSRKTATLTRRVAVFVFSQAQASPSILNPAPPAPPRCCSSPTAVLASMAACPSSGPSGTACCSCPPMR